MRVSASDASEDSGAGSLHRLRLRAFDLSERTARAGGRSAQRRADRWRARAFMIAQCAITSGLAWFIAQHVLGHQAPFFAPVAAIVTLGFSFGQRWLRAVEIATGVFVGVFTGDMFVHFFGTGVWQIIVVCAVAMSLATLLGAGNLIIIQAGIQAILVVTLVPASESSYALTRWLDALVGCVLALLVATVAPGSPIRKPRILAAQVLAEIEQTLRSAQVAVRDSDAEAAEAVLLRARSGEARLGDLSEAADEGLAVVRISPFLWHHRHRVQAYAELSEPLDRLTRNLRVLARRVAVATWRGDDVPLSYVVLMGQIADVVRLMSDELFERRLPVAARIRLERLGHDSSTLKMAGSLSSIVILAQLRSMIVDLLTLVGVDAATARDAVPEVE